MAIKFVKVRRKDDHTVTTEIARTSLRLWPGWEPIPDAGTASEPSPAAGTARVPTDPAVDASEPKTKRRAAATDDKEK